MRNGPFALNRLANRARFSRTSAMRFFCPLFLDLAILFITQFNWRCTQTKPVFFLDNAAQFQYSAVLYQDLPILYQDLSVLATPLRAVNNTHRKRERMNKQEHRCAHFGRV